MTTKDRTFDDIGPEELGQNVPAVYARSFEEAERYRQLLEDHGVPATVDEDYEFPAPGNRGAERGGLPVLVPESLLEDAKGFIASVEEMNDLVEEEDYLEDDEDDLAGEDELGLDEDEEI